MNIKDIRLTPLFSRFKTPYVWAMGKNLGQTTILVEVETDAGVIGYGETAPTMTSPDLTPNAGKIPVMSGPGLGFILNEDAVGRAAEAYDNKKGPEAT
ncbi:hypothetical protein AB833_05250 [Chromatiales bacterium (ex Bugula neritina AB1)]|nr:hypothetical protein AB833_05250 [Chromatiales bacterium (ex Bugula neritina AB1)]